jgi:nitroreductase
MSHFMKIVAERQSVRKYDPTRSVETWKIEQCVEAARLAPSACNAQPWKFIIVDQPELRKNIAKETYGTLLRFNKFVDDAPVIAVVTIEPPNFTSKFGTKVKNIQYPLIDIGIATQHFCLQAHELGVGTCMLGWFNEKPIQKLLNIPPKRKIALLISLGYPVGNYKQRNKQRKSINEMCAFNEYNNFKK